MNTKTMEGLIGARTNINIANVPMKVYKDAERRGDTATMERAIGYVSEFEVKADNYKTKAYDGMKEDAKEEKAFDIATSVHDLEKACVRKMILTEHRRPDGRAIDEIRPLSCEVRNSSKSTWKCNFHKRSNSSYVCCNPRNAFRGTKLRWN